MAIPPRGKISGIRKDSLSAFAAVAVVSVFSQARAQVPLSAYIDARGYADVQALKCPQLANTFQKDADYLAALVQRPRQAASGNDDRSGNRRHLQDASPITVAAANDAVASALRRCRRASYSNGRIVRTNMVNAKRRLPLVTDNVNIATDHAETDHLEV